MPNNSPDLLDTREAGQYLGGLLPSLLARWRSNGRGPDFVKLGLRVRYRREALDAWLSAQTRHGGANA